MPCIDTVQGFSFCPAVYQLLTIVYDCLSAVNAIIPPQRQNRLQGFTGAFPLICHIPARTIQQAHKPPIHRLRHVGGHTVKRSTCTDTRYNRHTGRCTGGNVSTYYNKVYKGAPLSRIHAGRCRVSQTMPAAAGQCIRLASGARVSPAACDLAPVQQSGRTGWHPPPGGAVQRQGRGGRRGTIGGCRRISFRAFAR